MEDSTWGKTITSQYAPRKGFTRWKEKPFRSKDYLEFLAHYDAGLQQTEGLISIVRFKTGAELPLEQKGKLLMVKALLDEFGTVCRANDAIATYKSSHS
jgi:hypothetical protein